MIGLVDLLERLGASLVDLLGVVVVDLLLSSDPLTAVTLAAGLALWTVAFGVATVAVGGGILTAVRRRVGPVGVDGPDRDTT